MSALPIGLLAASVASFAGCSGAASPPATTTILQSADTVSADLAAPGRKPVLYATNAMDAAVDLYPLNANNPAPIDQITSGLIAPAGMAVDAQGNLYVANNSGSANTVTVYPPGGKTPSVTYSRGLHNPTDVAVGDNGRVYVASYGDGYVTEYAKGSVKPSLRFHPPSGSAFSVALDAKNNLYVACVNTNVVYEFAPGSTQGTNLNLVLGGEPHGMAFDASGNLIVAVSMAPGPGSVIDVFPPGKIAPTAQFAGTFQPFMVAFDRTQRHLYVGDFGSGNRDGAVFEFAYPAGTIVHKYTQGTASGGYGVAVSPPAP